MDKTTGKGLGKVGVFLFRPMFLLCLGFMILVIAVFVGKRPITCSDYSQSLQLHYEVTLPPEDHFNQTMSS